MAFDFFGRKARKAAADFERRAEEYDKEKKKREIEDMAKNSDTQEKLKEFKSSIESKNENAKFIEAFKKVVDPELDVDIWTLGLIYQIEEDKEMNRVKVTMTLTSPMCPFGPEIIEKMTNNLGEIGFSKENVKIEVIFNPTWVPTEELKTIMFS